jgi:hypothetical protein
MSPKSAKRNEGFRYERGQEEEGERLGSENRGRRGLGRWEVDRELEEKVKHRLKEIRMRWDILGKEIVNNKSWNEHSN